MKPKPSREDVRSYMAPRLGEILKRAEQPTSENGPASLPPVVGEELAGERDAEELEAAAVEPPSATAAPTEDTPRVGELAGQAVEQCCKAAADHVRKTAEDFLGLAHALKAEAEALADDLEARGRAHAARLIAFTTTVGRCRSVMLEQRDQFKQFAEEQP